jgi:proteasome accessory factor B
VGAVDRLERLTNLVLVLLDARRPLTLAEIADLVAGYPEGGQARRQAFERDKRLLREEGIVISVEPSDDGRLGYRIRPEDYYLPPLDLAPEEQAALNLAVAGVHLDDRSGREALLKLGIVERSEARPIAALPALPSLPVLYEAVRERALVRFGYRGVARAVEPYGLLFRWGAWYLVGFDRTRGARRTFRVDRIEGDVARGKPGEFEVPSDLDLQAALPPEPWRIGDEDPVRATVDVDALLAPTVADEVGPEAVVEHRSDGSARVVVDVTNREAFRAWLLGLLDHAEVVDPPELRAEVVSWLTSIAEAS